MPTSNLNVAALPLDIIPGDIEANLSAATSAIAKLPVDTDLILLPELFNTGFRRSREFLERSAESVHGKTIDELATLASRRNAAIAGSFLCRTDSGAIANRGFILTPEGEPTFYDKHHLFSMGGEGKFIAAGANEAPVVEFRSWRIKLIICYDLRFPVWDRSTHTNPYDILLVPANWASSRSYAWTHLLIARAIENQAYAVGCNRSGADEYGTYPVSETHIFDIMGKPIGSLSAEIPAVTATFNADALATARRQFNVSADADRFTIY